MEVGPRLMNVIALRASLVIASQKAGIKLLWNADAVHLPIPQEEKKDTNTRRIETGDHVAPQVRQTPKKSVKSLRNSINTNILDEAIHKILFQAIQKIQSPAEENIDTQNTIPHRKYCCLPKSWKN